MSTSPIDSLLDMLGTSFSALSAILHDTRIAISVAEGLQPEVAARLQAALATAGPGMINGLSMTPGTGPSYDDLLAGVVEVAAEVGKFATAAVVQSAALVENLQSGLIASQANASLDAQLGQPVTDKFGTITSQAAAVRDAVTGGNGAILAALEAAEAAVALAVAARDGQGVVNAMNIAGADITAAAAGGESAIVDSVATIGSTAASTVRSAFQKGLKLALPSMGPDYVPPAAE